MASTESILKAAVQQLVELKRAEPHRWTVVLEAELARLVERLMK